ncbi:bifunctional hydroxymethylpyrimidine kinase/phosphomethylpyrimidine kinase [Curvivirga sp.]|uniref:bifunctional hydroxymethylpyrimidine kinase/phosphomethylpyrimidine kinase n=1 Tax=Curvivirga sp. TaxID=2856848 RepID=UPI003B5A38E4
MTNKTAIALTIAGSDSGGGAGIQADLKAMSALGTYGASVITALTAQNTTEVRAIYDVPADFIACQIDTVLDDLKVDAIKIGMLSQVDVIEAVADRLKVKAPNIPVVLDPVMVAKSGDKLLQDNAIEALRRHLVPLATLMTPNLPEAGVLLGQDAPIDPESMKKCGLALMALGASAVLMKGGHLTGEECVDLLMHSNGDVQELHSKRVHTGNTHGTGCTLSASIAALLAQGLDLKDAVSQAHQYLAKAIQSADQLTVGQGHGPVHHFHQFWSK